MDGNIERSENYINNINLLIDKTNYKKTAKYSFACINK